MIRFPHISMKGVAHALFSLSLLFLLCFFCFSLYVFWLWLGGIPQNPPFGFKICATMTTVNTNRAFTIISKALEECLTDYSQLKLPTESLTRVIMQNRCGISNYTHAQMHPHSHNGTLSHTTRMQKKNSIIYSSHYITFIVPKCLIFALIPVVKQQRTKLS